MRKLKGPGAIMVERTLTLRAGQVKEGDLLRVTPEDRWKRVGLVTTKPMGTSDSAWGVSITYVDFEKTMLDSRRMVEVKRRVEVVG